MSTTAPAPRGAQVLAAERPPWHHRQVGESELWFAGDPAAAEAILAAGSADDPLSRTVAAAAARQRNFAAIVRTPRGIVASTDHCRSYPIFYFAADGRCAVGNDARRLQEAEGGTAFDPAAVLEAMASGYVYDGRTLDRRIRQLRAGECLHVDTGGRPTTARSFVYRPALGGGPADAAMAGGGVGELAAAIDAAIADLISMADGAPILVPLSGGLDSRLILAKLAEARYPDIRAFSYGPRNNPDARIAREVARRLRVEWQAVVTDGRATRAFHRSQRRRDYARFCDNLCATPNYQDLQALCLLKDRGALPDDAVVVNGQTGDFITGGHIPLHLAGDPSADPIAAIIDRHCGLWRSLLDEEARGHLRARIASDLEVGEDNARAMSPAEKVALFERWEYEERQAKYIVNGQRSYEFMGLRWHLPLWHRGVVDACMRMPLDLRIEQRAYRQFLESWDYGGLFDAYSPRVTAWSPAASAVIVPLSVGMRLLLGRRRRDELARYLRYFDRFGNHYAAFGWRRFASAVHDIRNPIALYAADWLDEIHARPEPRR